MIDISYANASFYGCSFSSYQDTWYTGRNASTYVVDSIIYGQTDCEIKSRLEHPIADHLNQARYLWIWHSVCGFFLSFKKSLDVEVDILSIIRWFQSVVLANRACGGGLVAWKGTNFTDAPGNRYGAYIADSTIIRVTFIALVNHSSSLAFKVPRCERNNSDARVVLSRYG